MNRITIFMKRVLVFFIVSVAMNLAVFAQVTEHHIYIGGGGTPNYDSFVAAIDAANANPSGDITVIHLRKSVDETGMCTVWAGKKVRVINDTGGRLAIRYTTSANYTTTRMIGVVGEITFGGEGNTALLIVRGQNDPIYNYPTDDTATRVLLKVVDNGVINIHDNVEVCYGKNNIWIDGENAVVNQYGGIIHSAGNLGQIDGSGVKSGQESGMNVNITRGTFNMSGGYIMGHYNSTGNSAPDYSSNPILDYENFIASSAGFNGADYIGVDAVKTCLENLYPPHDPSGHPYISQINHAIGVYLHCSRDESGNPLAKFNMSGGYICGLYGENSARVIVGYNSTYYPGSPNPSYSAGPYYYYRIGSTEMREYSHAVVVNGGEFTMSGGKIYANYTNDSGGGVWLHCRDFDITDPDEVYTHSQFIMTGGEICYCEGVTGGAVRCEQGCRVEMSGGYWRHCTSHPNGGDDSGGGGAIRMVSAEFTMSGTAEISYNHCVASNANHGGGAIGAVWQPSNGAIATKVDLNGGTIAYNKSEGYGGGVSATDKGNTVTSGGGVVVEVKGCSIHDNVAMTADGGGLYICGHTDLTLDKNSSNVPTNIYSNTAAGNGGGVFVTSLTENPGTLESSNCNIYSNSAANGGGIYSDNANITLNSNTSIYSNTASVSGGGIYTNDIVTFSTGSITNNVANGNTLGDGGGGIYISSRGTLNINGTANITGNSTPTSNGHGGGVYQGGIMTAGMATGFITTLSVTGNTSGTAKTAVADNIYLPGYNTLSGTPPYTVTETTTHKTIKVGSAIDPNHVTLGIRTEQVAQATDFVNHDPSQTPTSYFDIPVLTVDAGNESLLSDIRDAILNGNSSITDDQLVHKPKYLSGTTLYFTKLTYDMGPYSDGDPFSGDINSLAQLYKYMCYVNGINGYTSKHDGETGNVTADIDMSTITRWIPIGEKEDGNALTTAFTGTFNGNGHTISDLTIDGTGGYTNYGLFGQTSGAIISNVNMKDCNMAKSSSNGSLGAIVGTMSGGTIKGCIASGTLTTTASGCVTGGLVGKVQTSADIHSSCATPTITGYQMGGLVGDLGTGCTLKNSFASVEFSALGSTSFMGGLVGENAGTVENCYSRVRGVVPATTYFGYLAGDNDGGILKYSYSAEDDYVSTNGTAGTQTGIGTYGPTTLVNGRYGYLQADQQIDASNSHVTNGTYSKAVGLTGLLATLNHWVKSAEGGAQYAQWMRTSASLINQDYPIHEYSNYVCVASRDNIGLEYSADFNDKFEELINANTGTIYLYQSPTADIDSDLSNSSGVPDLYIHEDVVLMHSSILKAHVGITLDNSAGEQGANPSWGESDDIDWHFFSSALTNATIGLNYPDASTPVPYGTAPAQATFTSSSQYFPTNLNSYYNDWDLYAYTEPDYHWINLKRNSLSHWHEDFDHGTITYTNPTVFNPGQGFLVATAEESYLQAYGTLNTHTSNFEKELSYTEGVSWTGRQGLNLLGNPYQSYLDFDAFATTNSGGEVGMLWPDIKKASYIIMDEDDPHRGYVQYVIGQSDNSFGANRYLHPHQGFMVVAGKTGLKAVFNNDMRNVTASATFRDGSRINYPLVNLFATDDSGNCDMVTVELGRPDKGGALKLHSLHAGKGSLYCHYEDEDYGIVFTQPGLDEANIRFATDEDCAYTMTWNTQNGEFGYLHLIDNITGMDIDCLKNEEYKFTSKTTDYKSRFRLVFGYTGVEENGGDGPSTSSGISAFAFQMGNELVVNGEGTLQIVDLNGHVIGSQVVHGTQSTVSLPNMAAGVYVLRMIGMEGTKVQKMVIR